jgi:hypothetical protein
MKLTCPSCKTVIPATHMNLERTLASCPQCDEVFNLAGLVSARKGNTLVQETALPGDVIMRESANQTPIEFPATSTFRPWVRIILLFVWGVAGVTALVDLLTRPGAAGWNLLVFVLALVEIAVYLVKVRIMVEPM